MRYLSRRCMYEKEMNKLEECRNLMQRICNLPSNDEELKKLGFDDDGVKVLRDTILLVDPDANRVAKKMQDILAYCDKLDSQKKKV